MLLNPKEQRDEMNPHVRIILSREDPLVGPVRKVSKVGLGIPQQAQGNQESFWLTEQFQCMKCKLKH